MRILNNLLYCLLIVISAGMTACRPAEKIDPADTNILHRNVETLTTIIIYDVFNPPVASRIYTYTSLAQYEALRHLDTTGNPSLTAMLNGFDKMPEPEPGKEYNYLLAGTRAFCTVAYQVRIFSKDSLKQYEDALLKKFKNTLSSETYQRSLAFGDSIGASIIKHAAADNYKETRGMPKFLGTSEDGKWRPTPPDYLDGAEAYWNKIRPFSLDSASQFRPAPPPAFNKDSLSPFYKMVNEVYRKSLNLTNEEKLIATYWDDNPFVIEHSGHMMLGNKKITPGGHWMGITAIACKQTRADAVKTAKSYALTALSLADAFISCWDTKYHYNYIRPLTIINLWMGKGEWTSFLQTPPFPEYSSGHSTISGAASTVLTQLFGPNLAFHDNSDSAYIGLTRDFPSFSKAAEEASISRFYGGIHFKLSLDTGLARGRMVGEHLLKRLKIK